MENVSVSQHKVEEVKFYLERDYFLRSLVRELAAPLHFAFRKYF